MKPLVLLSFSLTFLTQGIANDFSYEEASAQVRDEEYADDQLISFNDRDYLSDAQQPYETMSSQPNPMQQWCLSAYRRMHASIRHNESRGIGYNDGYTTLEAFGICDEYGSSFMPFLDIRGHVFNDGKLAGNLGIGERTYLSSIDHIFGSYLYYDVRHVGHGLTVNQLSPGVELVGNRMEYRINGYFPVGKQKGHKYGYAFDEFDGHRIILKLKQNQAMIGFDAEAGVHLTQSTKYDLYAAAGPYYFSSSNASSWGGRTRLLGRYKEYISLEVAYSYDNLFRSVVEGSVAVTLPFGHKLKRCGQCCPQTNNLLLSRAAFAPSRFEIPVVKKVHKRKIAINPATGDPWTVWFVNNTSHSAGTFESPFPTLLAAQNASSPNDMIYVFSGDGTTNGMSSGITLKDWQSFFGSGTKQHFMTTNGTITIPTFSNNMPAIAAGVTIGNGNVVSGFNVTSGTVGNTVATNLVNLKVINNIIASGIAFQGTGRVHIDNNAIFGGAVAGGTPNGIGLLAAPGGLITGHISNNSLNATVAAVGIFLENVIPTSPGRFDMAITNNVIDLYESAIAARTLGTNSIVTIIGNTVSTISGGDFGIIVTTLVTGRTGQQGHTTIKNNTVTWGASARTQNPAITVLDGIVVASPTFQEKVIIQNNNINLVGASRGGGFTVATANMYCVTMDSNTVTGALTGTPAIRGSFAFDTAGGGIINIDSFENNVGQFFEIPAAANVNFVQDGTCGN